MWNPVNLPPELFIEVMDYAVDGKRDLKSLCAFCLVDQQWYTTVSPRIYSRWLYDGDIYSFTYLWKFLRTVLRSARIAQQVHTLRIRNWGFPLHPDVGVCLSEEDFELVHNAVCKAGIQHLESSVVEALRKADRRPLVALLLTSLPNLATLYAHVPEVDVFFAEMLKQALEDQE